MRLAGNLHRDRSVAGRGRPSDSGPPRSPGRLQLRQQEFEEAMLAAELDSRGKSTRAVRTLPIANGICTFRNWTTL
jgi:hypothetical protein